MQPAPEAAPTSLLKKELHLFGGGKTHAKHPDDETPSLWKKELSFGRKKPASTPAPADDDDAAGEPSTPWYKKELSLGRKAMPEAAPAPVAPAPEPAEVVVAAEPIVMPEPIAMPEPIVVPEAVAPTPEPFFAPAPALSAPEPEPAPAPDPFAPSSEPDLVATESVAQAPEPEPASIAPAPEPALDSVPLSPESDARAPESVAFSPEPVLPPLSEPEAPAVSWVDAVLEGREYPAEPELGSEAPPLSAALPDAVAEVEPPAQVLPEPPVSAEPFDPVARVSVAVASAAEAPDPAPAPVPPQLPPAASIPEPEPREVHPPVRADELPPIPDEQPSLPWYKRELSLKRGPKQPKELRAVAVPSVAAEKQPTAKAGPFWKKELSFGRGPKQPKAAAKQQSSPTPAESANAADGGAPRKAMTAEPFWKRGVSLPTFTLPSFGRGGGHGSLPKQLVGLKVGASQLAAARVSNNGYAEVLQLARESLDAGIVVGGELRDPDALAEALKLFFARHKLPKRGVRLGNREQPHRRPHVRHRRHPRPQAAGQRDPLPRAGGAADSDRRGGARLPGAERERERGGRDGAADPARRRLSRARRPVSRRVQESGDPARRDRSRGVRAAPFARRAAGGRRAEHRRARRGGRRPRSLHVRRLGRTRVRVHARAGVGRPNLSVAIARTLDMTPSEAEPIKRMLSLDDGPAPAGLTEQQYAAVKEAVVRQVQTFARELVSSLQFYQSQPGSLGIGEIVLTGGTAHLAGFAAELQRVVGVRVRVGDPLVRVKVAKRMREPEQLGSLSVAIGLGIED